MWKEANEQENEKVANVISENLCVHVEGRKSFSPRLLLLPIHQAVYLWWRKVGNAKKVKLNEIPLRKNLIIFPHKLILRTASEICKQFLQLRFYASQFAIYFYQKSIYKAGFKGMSGETLWWWIMMRKQFLTRI